MIIEKLFKRIFDGPNNGFDVGSIDQNTYNDYAGAKKVLKVGPYLSGINLGSSFTTDLTTPQKIGTGIQLAVFNVGTAIYPLRIDQVLPVAIGVVGDVSETFTVAPCKAGDWTYLSTGHLEYVMSGHADLKVYIIVDDTEIRKQQG